MARRDTSDGGWAERKARDAMDRAGHEAGAMRDRAVDQGNHLVGTARDRIRALVEQQSHRAADQLGGVAHALHQAAQQLDQENQGPAAHYVDSAADRMDQVADTLRESTIDDLVGMVEGYARRRPELFIGAAVAAGFLFSRFVKSSGERRPAAPPPPGAAASTAYGESRYTPPGSRAGYPAAVRPAPVAEPAVPRPAPAATAPAAVPDSPPSPRPTPAQGPGPLGAKPQEFKP